MIFNYKISTLDQSLHYAHKLPLELKHWLCLKILLFLTLATTGSLKADSYYDNRAKSHSAPFFLSRGVLPAPAI